MEQALVTQGNAYLIEPAQVTPSGEDYAVRIPNTNRALTLERDVDFGKIPGTQSPCLYKAGAEKILWAYGVSTRAVVEAAIEDYQSDNPFFFYRVRMEAYKGDTLLTIGYGSANSREKACGRGSAFDVANSRLKIARKRAMVDCALMIGQLSSAFTQDMENDAFMSQAEAMYAKPESLITKKQVQRIYAIAASQGINAREAKQIIKSSGYQSTADIQQQDYDRICSVIEHWNENKEASNEDQQ